MAVAVFCSHINNLMYFTNALTNTLSRWIFEIHSLNTFYSFTEYKKVWCNFLLQCFICTHTSFLRLSFLILILKRKTYANNYCHCTRTMHGNFNIHWWSFTRPQQKILEALSLCLSTLQKCSMLLIIQYALNWHLRHTKSTQRSTLLHHHMQIVDLFDWMRTQRSTTTATATTMTISTLEPINSAKSTAYIHPYSNQLILYEFYALQ